MVKLVPLVKGSVARVVIANTWKMAISYSWDGHRGFI